MAAQSSIDTLKESIAANTSAVKSTTEALKYYAESTADLTEKLKAALEHDDDAEIEAAIAALDANTQDLLSHVPDVADAATEHTKSEDDDEPEEAEEKPGTA